MTDVVTIAKKCRTELTAEIAKLDDFIRMAEKLQQYETMAASEEVELTSSFAAPPPAATNGAGVDAKA